MPTAGRDLRSHEAQSLPRPLIRASGLRVRRSDSARTERTVSVSWRTRVSMSRLRREFAAVSGVDRRGQPVDLDERRLKLVGDVGQLRHRGPDAGVDLAHRVLGVGQDGLDLGAVDRGVEALGEAGDADADGVEIDAVDLGQELVGRAGDAVEAAALRRRHDEDVAVAAQLVGRRVGHELERHDLSRADQARRLQDGAEAAPHHLLPRSCRAAAP